MPSLGPRATTSSDMYIPTPLDSSAHHLAEMQRKMTEMANEIMKLRTEVRQSEIHHQIEIQREAAQNPLTYEEKMQLTKEIHKLPEYKQIQAFEIIRANNPSTSGDDNDEDVEVPLDQLDTLTMRKLQNFVQVRIYCIC